MEKDNKSFNYTYSAKQQQEVGKILKKYAPQEEGAAEKIKRLDNQAEMPGQIASFTFGIIGALVLGLGMTCFLEWSMTVLGVILSIVGIAMVCAAYPLYKKITQNRRDKIAPEIIRLGEEIKNS